MTKKSFNIKEVAKLYNISSNKLRFYEKKGLITPKRDPGNGYRVYDRKDLVKIQMILTYRLLEIPVETIKGLLVGKEEDSIIDQVFAQLGLVNDRIHKYKSIQTTLNTIVDSYVVNHSNEVILNQIIESGTKLGEDLVHSNGWVDTWNFDKWSETYDISVTGTSDDLNLFENYTQVLDQVHTLASIDCEPNPVILDIGVGSGALASMFLDQSSRVYGLDQSRRMLLLAKKKYPSLKLRVGDFLKLPFENHSVNRIVSTYAFHHLKDYEKNLAFDEMLRVINRRGRIVIGDMMFANTQAREKYLSESSEESRLSVEDEYYTDIQTFGAYVNSKGFKYSTQQVDPLMHILTIECS